MTEAEIFEKYPSLSQTEDRADINRKEIKSFTLRAQKLKQYQIDALEKYYDDYAIVYDGRRMDFEALFGNRRPVVIEIGFGMGDITFEIAKSNPDVNYIGIEVFLYGFSKLLSKVGNAGLKNIRLMRFDAVSVLEKMVDEWSVEGFNIFFPDPWQKKRHHKRRLIQKPFAELLASRLRKGGFIHCITDWEEYAEWMLDVFKEVPALENPYAGGETSGLEKGCAEGVSVPPSDNIGYAPQDSGRISTSFERKGLDKGHVIREIRVYKK